MRSSVFLFLGFALLGQPASPEYFVPTHRASGIGVARGDMPEETLAARTGLMIQTQTFAILREPQAVAGARRVTGDAKLQALFRSAAARSGFPQPELEAIAYLESWGDPKAESPAGPKGIMQIAEATAREMGLKVNTVHLTILIAFRRLIGGSGLACRGRRGKLLILRFTPRGLRRSRLDTTRSCRISSRTAL